MFQSFRMEDQWILAKDVVPTKSVKMSSLPLSARVQLTNQMYNLPPPSSTQRRGRKLKPQPRSTALSWHPDFFILVPLGESDTTKAF